MEKRRVSTRCIGLWLAVFFLAGLFSSLLGVSSSAQGDEGEGYDAYAAQLMAQGFPSSYVEPLWRLHQQYPAWIFQPQLTGFDWNAAIAGEAVLGRSLVQSSAPSSWKSTQAGAFNWVSSQWNELDSGGWVAASVEIIAYYMDPRNSLDSESVFQFLYQGYNESLQTAEGLEYLTAGTFLADGSVDTDGDDTNGINTWTDTLFSAGRTYGVNPYVLASMMIQEMGASGKSESISGTNSDYPGYYNAFNIGAYKERGMTAVQRGLWYAAGGDSGAVSWLRPWTSLAQAVNGGAMFYGENYISAGQNTLYLKRFNVQGNMPFCHQYMTNVGGAKSEGVRLAAGYSEEMRSNSLIFTIPVFENMSDYISACPSRDGSPNARLQSLSVDGAVMTPLFQQNTAEYTAVVPFSTNSVMIRAEAVSAAAFINGTGEAVLTVGENPVEITVTAENGASERYVIHVIRQEENHSAVDVPPLSAVSAEGGQTEFTTGEICFAGNYSLSPDGYITGIQPGTSAAEFLNGLGIVGGNGRLISSGGMEKTGTNAAAAGDVLETYNSSGDVKGRYTLLIRGDVNGDGKIEISDLIRLRNCLMGSTGGSEILRPAADLDGDGEIRINDLIRLRNHLLGIAVISQ